MEIIKAPPEQWWIQIRELREKEEFKVCDICQEPTIKHVCDCLEPMVPLYFCSDRCLFDHLLVPHQGEIVHDPKLGEYLQQFYQTVLN